MSTRSAIRYATPERTSVIDKDDIVALDWLPARRTIRVRHKSGGSSFLYDACKSEFDSMAADLFGETAKPTT